MPGSRSRRDEEQIRHHGPRRTQPRDTVTSDPGLQSRERTRVSVSVPCSSRPPGTPSTGLTRCSGLGSPGPQTVRPGVALHLPKPRGSHRWIETRTLRSASQGLARSRRAREAAGAGPETRFCRTPSGFRAAGAGCTPRPGQAGVQHRRCACTCLASTRPEPLGSQKKAKGEIPGLSQSGRPGRARSQLGEWPRLTKPGAQAETFPARRRFALVCAGRRGGPCPAPLPRSSAPPGCCAWRPTQTLTKRSAE